MNTIVKPPIRPAVSAEKPGQDLKWIGTNMKRVEDPRLLTGQGRYIDDIDLPNMLHAAVLRSPRAHARIKSIDIAAAAALPGVVKVLTGADIAKATGPLPCFANPASSSAASPSAVSAMWARRSPSSWPRAAMSPKTHSISSWSNTRTCR